MSKIVPKYKAIGSERRVAILQYLGLQPRNVQEIAKYLRVTLSGASFHLRKLKREGYVVEQRHGKYSYYFLPNRFKSSKLYAQILRG